MRSLFGNLHSPSSFSPLAGSTNGRSGVGAHVMWPLACLVAGWLQAAALAWPLQGWAPPGLVHGATSGWLQLASMALFVLAVQRSRRVGQAAWRGWLFATAWLVSTFWWLYVSMHTYGGLPGWLAALAVLALAAALALYYGLAAGALAVLAPRSRVAQAVMFAALWTLAELMRGQWLTGFPWGAAGYAHLELLAPWAPWIGVYGMGALAALMAYGLASVVGSLLRWLGSGAKARMRGAATLRFGGLGALVALALLLLLSLQATRWLPDGQGGTASTGALRVWLLQGNVAQDEKFVAGTGVAQALAWYPQQIEQAVALSRESPGTAPQLVVAPETALPMLPQQMGPEFWLPLWRVLEQPGAQQPVSVLLGLPLGSYQSGYTNSAWGLDSAMAARALAAPASSPLSGAQPGAGAGLYQYDKHHLVPFGEFIPPLFRWFVQLMNIPLGDFNRGGLAQPSWAVAGQRVAPNICYEDLFGEELAAAFRVPGMAPTVLVNLSNIGWFGNTVAIDQHLNASRLRTLELGRPMLRATNTGATAVIDHRGVVRQLLARHQRGRLEATVEGRSGTTPYARWTSRWGLIPVWVACLTLVMALATWRRPGARRRRG